MHKDILSASKTGIEPATYFQEGRHSFAVHFNAAGVRLQYSGNQLHQSTFAAAVSSYETDTFAPANSEANLRESEHFPAELGLLSCSHSLECNRRIGRDLAP